MPPTYTYKHPDREEYADVVQGMNESHAFVDFEGTPWKRVYSSPQMSIDTKVDPFSQKSFLDKTAIKKGTMGDIMDLSAELSEKRAASAGGEDPVKRKHFDDYKQKVGKKHLQDNPKRVETKDAIIDFD